MAEPSSSLFEDCRAVFEKGQKSWKSYFSKWEVFAKYEEEIPETELLSEAEGISKSSGRKKVKKESNKTKQKSLCKKNQEKPNKGKGVARESEKDVNTIEKYKDTNSENIFEDLESMQMETVLKAIFTDILKANNGVFPLFPILSQAFSDDMTNCSQLFHYQEALSCSDLPNYSQLMPQNNENAKIVYPRRSTYTENLCKNQTLINFLVKTDLGIREWGYVRSPALSDSFSKLKLPHHNLSEGQVLFPASGKQTVRQTTQINLSIKNDNPAVLSGLRHEDTKLKSLEWDLSLKSPNSVCRKINKEYFIKRNFLKMNITQDGKRFRNLCLRKRTNSVTLSMENSNFITPERKPPERKCFSENVLQRKRRCPSKLFFGNEEEDSESDDETEKRTPLIHCKNKKLKTQIISEVDEYDSDQCESIFDRVKV